MRENCLLQVDLSNLLARERALAKARPPKFLAKDCQNMTRQLYSSATSNSNLRPNLASSASKQSTKKALVTRVCQPQAPFLQNTNPFIRSNSNSILGLPAKLSTVHVSLRDLANAQLMTKKKNVLFFQVSSPRRTRQAKNERSIPEKSSSEGNPLKQAFCRSKSTQALPGPRKFSISHKTSLGAVSKGVFRGSHFRPQDENNGFSTEKRSCNKQKRSLPPSKSLCNVFVKPERHDGSFTGTEFVDPRLVKVATQFKLRFAAFCSDKLRNRT